MLPAPIPSTPHCALSDSHTQPVAATHTRSYTRTRLHARSQGGGSGDTLMSFIPTPRWPKQTTPTLACSLKPWRRQHNTRTQKKAPLCRLEQTCSATTLCECGRTLAAAGAPWEARTTGPHTECVCQWIFIAGCSQRKCRAVSIALARATVKLVTAATCAVFIENRCKGSKLAQHTSRGPGRPVSCECPSLSLRDQW